MADSRRENERLLRAKEERLARGEELRLEEALQACAARLVMFAVEKGNREAWRYATLDPAGSDGLALLREGKLAGAALGEFHAILRRIVVEA